MVEQDLAKIQIGVRFSLAAQIVVKSVEMCIKDKSLNTLYFRDFILSVSIMWLLLWIFIMGHVLKVSVFDRK